MNRTTTTPAPRDVVAAMMGLSKRALVDVALDAIAVVADNDSCEPEDLSVLLVCAVVNPRLVLRGDRQLEAPKGRTLTPRERSVLLAVRDSEYHDGRDPVGSQVWSNCLSAEGIEPSSLPGVVSSLSKKGLVLCQGNRNDSTVELTAEGAAALAAE